MTSQSFDDQASSIPSSDLIETKSAQKKTLHNYRPGFQQG